MGLIPNFKRDLLMVLGCLMAITLAACSNGNEYQQHHTSRQAAEQEISFGTYKGTIEGNKIYTWTNDGGHVCWMVANVRDYRTSISCY